MKKYFIFATALAALASCSSDDFVGESPNGVNGQIDGAISFKTNSNAITRAGGSVAADLLNNNFVVEGIKTIGATPTKSEVFDNYNVNWTDNTAHTTASNSANWEYVNQSILSGNTEVHEQTIKYWDFAASQYDFWGYSLGKGTGTPATVASLDYTASGDNAGPKSYTITGDKNALSRVYISDLVTAYATSEGVTGKPVMGNEVELNFRSLVSKVRVGLYETVPGYSIKEVKFYPATGSTAEQRTETATLYASSEVLHPFPATGNLVYTVTFPTTGKANASNSDYNKAHVNYTSGGTAASTVTFGTLSYGAKHKYEKTDGNKFLRIDSAEPTWAVESGAKAGDYSIVMPYEAGTVLTLKVDYTLESTDGTGETTTVYGATALIPAEYTKWKANYAYTYLFKISDNTNGFTNVAVTDKEGLYPITLNAVVVGSTDGTQETITTVATPSITTYSLTSDVTTNNEYTASDDIYVTASEDGTLMSLTGKATLYDITKGSTPIAYGATEAEVLAALTTYSDYNTSTHVYTGRNGVILTPKDGALGLTGNTIPTVDGQTVSVTAGQVALIDKGKLTAGHYYAFVYEITAPTGAATTKYDYTTVDASSFEEDVTPVTSYYITADGITYTAATGNYKPGTTYYNQYTYYETNGKYAIKVIKIKN